MCIRDSAEEDQQPAADAVDDHIVTFDPVKRGSQRINKHGTEQERDPQAQRIGQQHQHALHDMPLLRCV